MDSATEYPTGERATVGTWRPLGCGDRLYIESLTPLPSEVVDRLESLAGTMRDLVRAHRVVMMDIGPYATRRLKQPSRGERRRAEDDYADRYGANG